MGRKSVYGLGILLLGFLVLLVAVLRLRVREEEGFQATATVCAYVKDVQYVRIEPSDFKEDNWLIINQLQVFNSSGANVSLLKPVTGDIGPYLTNWYRNENERITSFVKSPMPFSKIVDGTTLARRTGYLVNGSAPSQFGAVELNRPRGGVAFAEIDLGSAMIIGKVVFQAGISYNAPDGSPRYQEEMIPGAKITLLGADRSIKKSLTLNEPVITRTFDFCSVVYTGGMSGEKEVINAPSTIKCQSTTFQAANVNEPGNKRWLCDTFDEAALLINGPPDSSQSYLRRGDIICGAETTDKKTYKCYSPYDPTFSKDDLINDSTPNWIKDTYEETCDNILKSASDMKDSEEAVGGLDKSLELSMTELDRRAKEGAALQSNMGCAGLTASSPARLRTLCLALTQGTSKIADQWTELNKKKTEIADAKGRVASSRTFVNTQLKNFSCP